MSLELPLTPSPHEHSPFILYRLRIDQEYTLEGSCCENHDELAPQASERQTSLSMLEYNSSAARLLPEYSRVVSGDSQDMCHAPAQANESGYEPRVENALAR